MNKLEINEEYSGIDIKACFNSKLNILVSGSGTGKTLLLSALNQYCLKNNIRCRMCNYNDTDLSAEQLITFCSGADVLLLDNADLYMTNHLLSILLNTSKIIVMSMKGTSSISTSQSEQYLVEYSNLKLSVRKI